MSTTAITVALQSDTIFGCGYSIPGGEDIAVKKDAKGYPYLSGGTLKGLLREETENWLEWSGAKQPKETLGTLFGDGDNRHGAPSPRRVYVSPLTLAQPPEHSHLCYRQRTFTKLEDGMEKNGSLRVAACIVKGLTFTGTVSCAQEDETLIASALRCIKYIGSSRTRGFGRVSVSVGKWEPDTPSADAAEGCGDVLCYALHTEQPLRLTDRNNSYDTFYGTMLCIPAGAVRGVVLNRLAQDDPDWFAAHKSDLLRQVLFGAALPTGGRTLPPLPTIKGFYQNKLGDEFYHLFADGTVKPDTKRAKLGSFCALDTQTGEIDSWSAKTGEDMHIRRPKTNAKTAQDKEQQLFQTSWLASGQQFCGSVRFTENCDAALRQRVAAVLSGSVRLGAGVYSGCGLCTVTEQHWTNRTPEAETYGYAPEDTVPAILDLLLLSPTTLVDEAGEPCGITTKRLKRLLGVPVSVLLCSTSVISVAGYNRTLGSALPEVVMYDSGSIFHISCKEAPDAAVLRALEEQGIGFRRQEGFGRVLFVKSFGKITGKRVLLPEIQPGAAKHTLRYQQNVWLKEHALPEGLSASQKGDIQARLTSAQPDGVEQQICAFFDRIQAKSPEFRDQYQPMRDFVNEVLTDATIPANGMAQRLDLLCQLFDLDRKGDN